MELLLLFIILSNSLQVKGTATRLFPREVQYAPSISRCDESRERGTCATQQQKDKGEGQQRRLKYALNRKYEHQVACLVREPGCGENQRV
jgi:hypothetical protein